ncbi:MAG: TlyA family RNA methyltransferase [Proteobacteria bacterium]|nr:TlyA family RNA methyltransferase [Pseudomonadota bacterium]
MKGKIRIDKLLFERGLAPSRERAQAYIMAGKVLVDERIIDKPGTKVEEGNKVRVKGVDQPFVGRGGLKMQKALYSFQINVRNKVVMDVGASTGGFTDCLLQNGASYVFAIDVGQGQLDWQLVSDKRVLNVEKTHFSHLPFERIGTFVDLIVIDVSFISLKKIFPNCMNFLKKGGDLIALIKPQFEAGRDKIEKKGIVSDSNIHTEVINSTKEFAQSLGFVAKGVELSPIQGKKSGNREFLIHLVKQNEFLGLTP